MQKKTHIIEWNEWQLTTDLEILGRQNEKMAQFGSDLTLVF